LTKQKLLKEEERENQKEKNLGIRKLQKERKKKYIKIYINA